MNQIEVRLANDGDSQNIALLGRITFAETFGHLFNDRDDLLTYLDETFSVQKIKNSISKTNNIYWIALLNDLPVGYSKIKLHSKSEFIDSIDICQLQKIYVLKDFLSFKIGSEMQYFIVNESKELGFRKIWLSVLSSNDRAINFYRKHEFYNIGKHNFQIGKENFEFIAMCKDLRNA